MATVPPWRLDQAARERQPQAGAGVPLGRAGVELLELDEQPLEVLGLDADAGVLDLEAEACRARRRRRATVTWPPSGVNLMAFDR